MIGTHEVTTSDSCKAGSGRQTPVIDAAGPICGPGLPASVPPAGYRAAAPRRGTVRWRRGPLRPVRCATVQRLPAPALS